MKIIQLQINIGNMKMKIKKIMWYLFGRHVIKFIHDDEKYIRFKWWFNMTYRLNLETPKSYNEKQNWLKLHDRKAEYTTFVDKYLVKDYVKSIVGE